MEADEKEKERKGRKKEKESSVEESTIKRSARCGYRRRAFGDI
jgi:hypothetical protein